MRAKATSPEGRLLGSLCLNQTGQKGFNVEMEDGRFWGSVQVSGYPCLS